MNKPTVIDLFCGAGGASLGLHRAGFTHRLCVDMDEDAVATIKAAGFPGVVGMVEDTTLYDGGGGVNLVWMSPPCQPWSAAGRRRSADDQRDGFPAAFSALDTISPTWVISENVQELARDDYWLKSIVPEFKKRFEWVAWKIIRAVHYDVPQDRRRLVLIAGPRPMEWPRPWCSTPVPASTVVGEGYLRVEQRGAAGRSTSQPSPTTTTRGNLYFYNEDPGMRRTKDPLSGGVRCTPEQIAGLQGFPPDWPFRGRSGSRHRQAGNAVPPAVAEALGKAIMAAMPITTAGILAGAPGGTPQQQANARRLRQGTDWHRIIEGARHGSKGKAKRELGAANGISIRSIEAAVLTHRLVAAYLENVPTAPASLLNGSFDSLAPMATNLLVGMGEEGAQALQEIKGRRKGSSGTQMTPKARATAAATKSIDKAIAAALAVQYPVTRHKALDQLREHLEERLAVVGAHLDDLDIG